jgi:hypothetical protein
VINEQELSNTKNTVKKPNNQKGEYQSIRQTIQTQSRDKSGDYSFSECRKQLSNNQPNKKKNDP